MHLLSEQNLLQMEMGYEKKSGTEEDSKVLDLNIWKHGVFTTQDGEDGNGAEWREDEEPCLGHVRLEMSTAHPRGDVREAVRWC